MRRTFSIVETPHPAAFLVCGLLLAGCRTDSAELRELALDACEQTVVPIESIQGPGYRSPMLDQPVTVRGMVTLADPDSGVYIEEGPSNNDEMVSRGLFLQNPSLATRVRAGDSLTVSGTVTEVGRDGDTITSLAGISGFRVCVSGQPLPESPAVLPMRPAGREALEAMRISFSQPLYVSDPWEAGRGELTLANTRVLPTPTEVARPGQDAREKSAENRISTLKIRLADDESQLLPSGTGVLSLTGVMGHDGEEQRLVVNEPLRVVPVRIHRVAPPGEKDLRVVSLNLHNYFNGDGSGGGFPTPRGAETPAEFTAQRARLAATIEHLQPHVVAVMELENDGFGPDSAAQDFIRDLEGASGTAWRAAHPESEHIGGDVIKVGIFYREDRVEPSGEAEMLTGPDFDRLSRVPLAQTFIDKANGQPILVVVNHLKSKGSCPEQGPNANRGDGQACWSPARTSAAKVMTRWAKQLANQGARGRALIVGDMNAYHMEAPITAILDAGFLDLNPLEPMQPEFSTIFYGQAGTLDYAFASPELKRYVQSSMVPNFNSIYARELDLPLPWLGASDHDPVVVDLRLRQ